MTLFTPTATKRRRNRNVLLKDHYQIHLLRTGQRRLSHDTMSQTNASVRTYSYHSKRHGPPEVFYGLTQRKTDNSSEPLQVTNLNATAKTITTSSRMINDQRNFLTSSQSSKLWQTSGVTVFWHIRRTRLRLGIGRKRTLMPSNDTAPSHASSSSLRTRRGGCLTR